MPDEHKSEVIIAIQKAANDQKLHNLPLSWDSDWLTLAQGLNISEYSIHLMLLLEKLHPDLSHALFRVGGSAASITPAVLAKWLIQRANSASAEEAYSSVLNLESNNDATVYNVTLINGLKFNGSIKFGNNIELSDFNHLPDSIKKNVSQKIEASLPNFRSPHTFLFQPMRSNLVSRDIQEIDETIISSIKSYMNSESLIVNFLSLFSINHAPVIDRRWCLLEESVPLSGLIDNFSSSYLEIKPPKTYENWETVDIENISCLYSKYIQIPMNRRRPIDISLWRRAQAMNTWDNVNKAIDLGIALESVLTAPKTREQLSLQIRLLGAKLASSHPDERAQVYSTLKCVYNIRSSAVHNGMVDNSYKVTQGQEKESTNSILDKGIAILGNCLKEIIRRNGLTPEDAERLFIE